MEVGRYHRVTTRVMDALGIQNTLDNISHVQAREYHETLNRLGWLTQPRVYYTPPDVTDPFPAHIFGWRADTREER